MLRAPVLHLVLLVTEFGVQRDRRAVRVDDVHVLDSLLLLVGGISRYEGHDRFNALVRRDAAREPIEAVEEARA